jgi:general nucleoside transport system ATP-binding protein
MTAPLLSLHHISKSYGHVLANRDVSLSVMPGQAHAVLGENGAGKSTLMKIIYGRVLPDEGNIFFQGQAARIQNPGQARALGIGMVFQHFNLFDTLTVAENVWLGLDQSIKLPEVRQRIVAKASEYGLDLEPDRPVHTLGVGEMQRVEIIRALLTNPKLLILDEPTSVLTPQAVDKLFVVLKQLVAQGCSLLYISHKLHEIRELCSACTVLRGGEVVGHCDPREESNASLSQLMIGAPAPQISPSPKNPGAVTLHVQHLSLPKLEAYGVDLHDIHLQVRAGEVLGVAGVSGNGQRELLWALAGEDTRSPAECIVINVPADEAPSSVHPVADPIARPVAHAVGQLNPQARRALGLHFVPEERLGRGAVPSMSLAHNLLLTRNEALGRGGWIRQGVLHEQALRIIERFKVKAAGAHAPAESLSGGNLQKFIVGREMAAQPKLLIVSQPTWGVDVGAAAQIRREILDLAAAGCAVLVVSEELDELFEICDRLQVMAKGRLSPSVPRAEASVALIGEWMSGLWPRKETHHAAA